MPLLHRPKPAQPAQQKKLHRVRVAGPMNTLTARAKAVYTDLAARLTKPEVSEALGTDATEAKRFVEALETFLTTIGANPK